MKLLHFYVLLCLVVAPPFFCWAQKISTGVYINDKSNESYIELRPDGIFYLSSPERWGSATGQYRTENNNLTLVVERWQGTTLQFKVSGNSLIFEDRQKWVLWPGGKTRKEYTRRNSFWNGIMPGQTEDGLLPSGLALTKDGLVLLDGKRLGEFSSFDPSAAEVLTSPPSSSNRFTLILLWDQDKGGQAAYVVDLKNNKTIDLKGFSFIKWVSWSPDEKYAIIASYYEADMLLFRIELPQEDLPGREGLAKIAASAHNFRIRPKAMGGGGGSYIGFTIPYSSDDNAQYSIVSVSADEIKIKAVPKRSPSNAITITVGRDWKSPDGTDHMKPVPIKLAKDSEEQRIDIERLRWINPETFNLQVTIHCNPYTNPNCKDKDRKKVLRSYEVQVNASTLAVSYKKSQ